ncbi:MAG: sulfite exporter TauE/SafE family protein [Leptospirillum sp.]|jgi:hypothetical protein
MSSFSGNIEILILLLGGTISGMISGLLGIGGAIVLIPFLLFILPIAQGPHLTPFVATQISLFQVALSGIVGFLSHRVNSALPTKKIFLWGGSSLLGGALGGVISHDLRGRTILMIYAFEVAVAVGLLLFGEKVQSLKGEKHSKPGKEMVIMSSIGLVSGILGIGGGFLYYPVITGLLGYTSSVAVGCGLALMIPMAIAGSITKTITAGSIPMEGIPVIFGAILGAYLGAKLHYRLSKQAVKTGQLVLLTATFIRILWALY